MCRFARFYGSEDGKKCAAFEVGVRTTMDVLRVVKRYYETDFAGKVQQPPWDILHNMPNLLYKNSSTTSSSSTGQLNSEPVVQLLGRSFRPGHVGPLHLRVSAGRGACLCSVAGGLFCQLLHPEAWQRGA